MRYITIRTHQKALTDQQKEALAQGIERALDAVVQDDEPNWLVFEHAGDGGAMLLDQYDAGAVEGRDNSSEQSVVTPQHPVKAFAYHSDFDGQGIVSYLAGGLSNYRNPAETGLVVVSSSPLAADSEPASAIVGTSAVRCVTAPRPNAWFALDFNERSIAPTHYSLRHYSSWDTEALRTWTFEASVDGQNWIILRSHIDDTSLNAKGATHTWNLPGSATPVFYRYFRVLQRGLNSNRHNFLALSGFEIYGQMQEPAGAAIPEKTSTVNVVAGKGLAGKIGRLFGGRK